MDYDDMFTEDWKEITAYDTGDIDDDDAVVLQFGINRFVMSKNEFECLAGTLHELAWVDKITNYIQIVKEWNECIGHQDINGDPSVIDDMDATKEALIILFDKFYGDNDIKRSDKLLSRSDLTGLIDFVTMAIEGGINTYIYETYRADESIRTVDIQ